MPDSTSIVQKLVMDSEFKGLPENERLRVFREVVGHHDPEYAALPEEEQVRAAKSTFAHYYEKGGGAEDPKAQIGKPVPKWLSAAERVAEVPAWIVGEGLGGLGGAAAAAPLGPEAIPVGGYAGARAGGAAAQTGMDIGEAALHHKLYNTPVDMSGKKIAEDYAANLGGSVVGHGLSAAAMPMLGKFGRSLLGLPEVESAMRGATDQSQVARRAVQEHEGDIVGAFEKKGLAAIEDADKKAAADVKVKATSDLAADEAKLESERRAALGRSPQETMAAVGAERSPEGLATPEALERRGRMLGAYFEPVRRMSDKIGGLFNERLGKYRAQPAEDLTPLMQAVGDETAYRKQSLLRYDPQVSRLIGQVKRLAKIPLDEDEEKLLTASSGKVFMEQGGRGTLKEMAALPTSVGEPDEIFPLNKPASVGNLLGLRSAASRAMATAKDGPSRSAAHHIVQATDETLSNLNVPEATDLRALYREHVVSFPHALGRKFSGTSEPSDMAKDIFDVVPRAQALVTAASPEEKASLKEMWVDHVNQQFLENKNATIDSVIKPQVNGVWLDKLLPPNSPILNPRQLASIDQRIATLSQMPQFRQQYQAAVNAEIVAAKDEGARKIRDLGLKHAKTLGPIGHDIIQRINAGKTPEEQAAIATEAFTGLTPDKFIQALASEKYPAMVARGISQDPSMKKGLMPWILRMGESPGAWKWYLLGAIATGAIGMPSHFMELIAGLGAGMEARRGLQTAFIRSLRDPVESQAFVSSVANLGDRHSMTRLARMTIQAGLQDTAARIGKSELNVSLEGKSAEPKRQPLPSPPRNPIDPGEIKDHGKGALTVKASRETPPPKITSDLRSGKLSSEDVRDALKAEMERRNNMGMGGP